MNGWSLPELPSPEEETNASTSILFYSEEETNTSTFIFLPLCGTEVKTGLENEK